MQFKSSFLKSHFTPSRSGEARDVLLLVHGRGGNIKLLQFFAKRFDLPSLNYLALEAPYPEQREDQVAKGESGWSWYLMPGHKGLDESREKLFGVLREINSAGFNYNRIYWLGFSQGGAMGLEIFLQFPEVLGGALCISGLCVKSERYPKAFSPVASKQRILITHGERDEIISKEKAEATYKPLFEANLTVEYRIYDKPHSFHLNEEIPFLEQKLKSWMGS